MEQKTTSAVGSVKSEFSLPTSSFLQSSHSPVESYYIDECNCKNYVLKPDSYNDYLTSKNTIQSSSFTSNSQLSNDVFDDTLCCMQQQKCPDLLSSSLSSPSLPSTRCNYPYCIDCCEEYLNRISHPSSYHFYPFIQYNYNYYNNTNHNNLTSNAYVYTYYPLNNLRYPMINRDCVVNQPTSTFMLTNADGNICNNTSISNNEIIIDNNINNGGFHPDFSVNAYKSFKTNNRIFNCTYPGCTKSYGRSGHLKAHIRVHTGERPFLCTFPYSKKHFNSMPNKHVPICGKYFTRSDELSRHFRKHTNSRPFSCPICSKSFARSDHLNTHVLIHNKFKINKQKSNLHS